MIEQPHWAQIRPKHTSEMEFYITLATLENCKCWNQTLLITKCHHFKKKLVQCSPAMVDFSLDKINILQHIKFFFSAIALAHRALDGLNRATITNLGQLITGYLFKQFLRRNIFHPIS